MMEASERDKLRGAIGPEDAAAVERFLGSVGTFGALIAAAESADCDWPEWACAAAILQRWLEERGRDAQAGRKIGYLHCTIDAQKVVPTALRPVLAQAVARMLKDHGFAE